MKNNFKKLILYIFLTLVALLISFDLKLEASASSFDHYEVLSSMDNESLHQLLKENEIEIPEFNLTTDEIMSFAKFIIGNVENEKEYSVAVNYGVLKTFIDSVIEFTIEYYGASNETYNLNKSLVLYNSLVMDDGEWVSTGGDWNSKWSRYNCYAYATKRSEYPAYYDSTEFQYQPGDFSKNFQFSHGMDVEELADGIVDDLTSLGYNVVYNGVNCPTEVGENQELICVRVGNFIDYPVIPDYHFMRYDKLTNSWYHKPSDTAVLKYKYTPSKSLEWTNENSKYGIISHGGIMYEGNIHFILYDVPTINLDRYTTSTTINDYLNVGMDRLYKITIKNAKNYSFEVNASNPVQLTFYDDDMNTLTNIIPTMSNNDCVGNVVVYLDPGTYYIRINHISRLVNGNFTITYQATYPVYNVYQVGLGSNYNLPTNIDVSDNGKFNLNAYYINSTGPGFYKFTFEAVKNDDTTSYLDQTIIEIYDHNDEYQEYKYNVNGLTRFAETENNNNYLYAYLDRDGYYYIRIYLPESNYANVNLIIERVSGDNIDIIDRYDSLFTETIFDECNSYEYVKSFSINQLSVFDLSTFSNNLITDDVSLIIFKEEYNNVYNKIDIINESLPINSERIILDEGRYYIGLFGNENNISISVAMTRVLTTLENSNDVIIMDINSEMPYGTEVRYKNGEFGGLTITEGFTRHIHFQSISGVPSISRYSYNFYSNNEEYATVSEFGTVLAKSVSKNEVVTIIAVYKFDPSIVFSIDLTIINDVSNEEVVIQTTQIVKISNLLDGKYKVVLNETNCPHPWFQSYNWYIIIPDQMNEIFATIDDYGYISVDGIGGVLLIGNYELNPNVTVKINISFE